MLRFLFSGNGAARPGFLLVAVGCLMCGGALAGHHPIWPTTALLGFGVWCLVAWWRRGVWLVVVPACLALLNFSPWTGWLMFDEFDLLLLGALAGGYIRLAWSTPPRAAHRPAGALVLLASLLGLSSLCSLYRGVTDAGGFAFDWFAGYTDPLNSVRQFKSLAFALLFMPLIQQEMGASKLRAGQRLATGIVAGLATVSVVVLWERLAFPGLLDFSANYRTTALFWEMHVGGAALDSYLVMAVPFVVWAVIHAPRPVHWAGAAALAVLTGHALLTTFSRGVYFATAGALIVLALPLLRHRHGRAAWRTAAGSLLALTLLAEAAVVLGGGSFMLERLGNTDRDLGSRAGHWQRGAALLKGRADWLFGKGLGRFPANYAARGPQGEFSGAGHGHAGSNPYITLSGPKTMKTLGGLYALTQRVDIASPGPYRIALDARVQGPTRIQLELCERHLLYDGTCQSGTVRLVPGSGTWQTILLPLQGPAFNQRPWYARRPSVLSISIDQAAGAADVDNLSLTGPARRELLDNGNFSRGLARWFPAAQSYFLPWHTDSLFLELLIERGWFGVLLFFALLGYALWQLTFGRARSLPLAPYLTASIIATLLVGLASSVLDVPRVAFQVYLLALFSIQMADPPTNQHTA